MVNEDDDYRCHVYIQLDPRMAKNVPDVVPCPDNEVNFVFEYLIYILKCRIYQAERSITRSIWYSKVSCCAIIIFIEIRAESLNLQSQVMPTWKVRDDTISSGG